MNASVKRTSRTNADPAAIRAKLSQISVQLFSSAAQGNLQQAVIDLHSLLAGVTGAVDCCCNPSLLLETRLAGGEIVLPKAAVRGVADSAGTPTLLRATLAALVQAQEKFLDKPLEILYSGCGSYAALAIPLTAIFKSDQIRFTLVDAHSQSVESVRRLFDYLGLAAYVNDYIRSDDEYYVHRGPLQIVIARAMQRGLSKRPEAASALDLDRACCLGHPNR